MKNYYLITILCFIVHISQAQITIQLQEIPVDTPSKSSIYIAGNFQGWNPNDDDYRLTQVENGTYEITISPSKGKLEFKFTRGSWETVEGDSKRNGIANRTFVYKGGKVNLDFSIENWQSQDESDINSTAQSNVHILDEDFYMPQLDRNRKIWIYLPPDYDSSLKNYPVLYMHDGQNVFDKSTSFSGEWKVDESMNRLFDDGDYGAIVVAIDNGQNHRMNEYSPWINSKYGGGEGASYLEFIVHTLKPHIDSTFRTLSSREYTGLMGSSMGGLISMYGGIEYQDLFSKLGVFSPSYWFSNDAYEHVTTKRKTNPMKIYTLMGKLEGKKAVKDVHVMERVCLEVGFEQNELNLSLHTDGEHKEWYWAREFESAYKWLFGDLDFSSAK